MRRPTYGDMGEEGAGTLSSLNFNNSQLHQYELSDYIILQYHSKGVLHSELQTILPYILNFKQSFITWPKCHVCNSQSFQVRAPTGTSRSCWSFLALFRFFHIACPLFFLSVRSIPTATRVDVPKVWHFTVRMMRHTWNNDKKSYSHSQFSCRMGR